MSKKKRRKGLRWFGLSGLVALFIILGSGAFSVPFSFSAPALAATPRHYTELELPPLPEVTLPEYERYQLENGIVVYLMENHSLPLVRGSAMVRTGSRFEPSEQVGLAQLTGTVMRSGGTQQHPADELNEMLEQRAASVETSIGQVSGSASFDALSEDLETVFGLFTEVLKEPAFPTDRLELAKTQLQGQIARRNDNPGDITAREFQKLIYGDDSPYARTVEYSTLANIDRDDLVSFYQSYFQPQNMILGIYGDFDPARMRQRIENAFGRWQPTATVATPEVPSATQQQSGGVFFIEQPQLTQSNIRLGHIGGQFNQPDYPALDVMNGVLNGFGGRLFNEVRSRQGLAYSVFGVWSPRNDYDGMFMAGGQTRSDATVPFIQSVFSEIERIRTTPITEAELAYAKDSILNSFVFQFQDPNQTLARLMRYEYYDYPQDFIFQYQQGVMNTTIEDVQRVAQEYLNPDQIVTLVVGNSAQIQPSLNELGRQVRRIDISIPPPPSN